MRIELVAIPEGLDISGILALIESMRAKDSSINKITFSGVPGDGLRVHWEA